ncbi:MAG TPA: AraC family transcriptional regulator [Chthoniobacteraceae bacterium]|nr:AraC family transcriptional regulator [Chthoniobacteraceae bacterium]
MSPPFDWSRCTLKLTRSGHAIESGGWHLDSKWFSACLVDYDLWFIVRGRGRFTTQAGEDHALKEGTCIWMRMSDQYDYQVAHDSEIEMYFLHFEILDPQGVILPPSRLRLPPLMYETFNPQFYTVVCRQIYRLLHGDENLQSSSREQRHAQATALLKSLLLEYENESGGQMLNLDRGIDLHYQKVISQAIRILDEVPREIASVSQLAERVGYSTDHFSKIFKQISGHSPMEAIISRRIKHACSLLRFSDRSIGNIADHLGYQSPFYFTRQFTKALGMSPAAYRRQHRESGSDAPGAVP